MLKNEEVLYPNPDDDFFPDWPPYCVAAWRFREYCCEIVTCLVGTNKERDNQTQLTNMLAEIFVSWKIVSWAAKQTCALPSVLTLKVKGQGQRSPESDHLYRIYLILTFASISDRNFFSFCTDRQTDRQTDAEGRRTSWFA